MIILSPIGLLFFNAIIENLNLREIALSGRKFTASRRQTPTYEKLDRVLASVEWEQKFPLVTVRALTRSGSGHTPLLIDAGIQAHGTIVGDDSLRVYISEYYKMLFGDPEPSSVLLDESIIEDIPQLSAEENQVLIENFLMEEVHVLFFGWNIINHLDQMVSLRSFINIFGGL
jgi:hypothetical protein